MSKYKQKRERVIIPPKVYSEAEIKKAIEEMDRFAEKGKWTMRSWMRWMQHRGAIKIYDINQNSYGVIVPEFTEMRKLEDEVHKYLQKKEFVDALKVEGLEELAQGMKIE